MVSPKSPPHQTPSTHILLTSMILFTAYSL